MTTDYLIKGEKSSIPSSEHVAAPSEPIFENISEDAGLRYCEKTEGYGSSVFVNAASVDSEKYVVTLKINFKSVFKALWAAFVIFLGFIGCVTAISTMSQYHCGFVTALGMTFLLIVSAVIFIAGLSAFAGPLMRFSKLLNRLFYYIQNFVNDFMRTFKAVKAERMSHSVQCASEKTEEAAEPAAVKKRGSFSKKLIGLLLTLVCCYISAFLIYMIVHSFDNPFWRDDFGLIIEIILLLVFVTVATVGLRMFLQSSKSSEGTAEEKFSADDILDNKTEIIAAAAKRKEEKALKIREKAEIKAAAIMEKSRLQAEKTAPLNEAEAEKIVEKGKVLAAQVLERGEKKAEAVLNGRFNQKGAHVK